MSSATTAAARASAAGGGFRQFWAIDTRAAFIAGAQTWPGRLGMTLLALAAVLPHFGVWTATLAVLAAMAAASRPQARAGILVTATWGGNLLALVLGENDTLDHLAEVMRQEGVAGLSPALLGSGLLLALLVVVTLGLTMARRWPQSLPVRRPVLTLLGLEAVLVMLAAADSLAGLPRAMLWSAIFVLTPYLWFLPYAIIDQRGRTPAATALQLGTLRPFWSPTYLPFGKGAGYLAKYLPKNAQELAVTQLKAVKLLLWSNLLFALRSGLDRLGHEPLGIPEVGAALDAFLAGQPVGLGLGWASLVLGTALFSLQVAAWAHLFIGIARLAGYRLPRGSWRPLESRTLMDYFNRFHYYFKELLVDLFFMPTFFKMFRGQPRWRMFFATFMAAGVGNALWHFTRDIHLVATEGARAAGESFTSYAFYCLVLACGVGLSQVRANRGIRPPEGGWGRLYSFLFVWSFVVCLHVFSDGSRNHTLGERAAFLASLFGVS